MALPPRFEDGIRERAPDIDGERDPAGVSWPHGPRLYLTASRSRAGKAILARRRLCLAGLSISNGGFDNEGEPGWRK